MVSDAESHPRGAAIKRVRLKSARNADSGLFLGTAMRGFLNQGIYCRVESRLMKPSLSLPRFLASYVPVAGPAVINRVLAVCSVFRNAHLSFV